MHKIIHIIYMVKISEIIDRLETFAPIELQEGYDNCGLQVGDRDMSVDKALLCTDVIEAVVDEAIEKNIKLIIAHHPLLFRGLKQITGKSYIERIVCKAIKNDIAIYCAHTNMDKCYGGVSYKMAEKLNLNNVMPLVADEKDSKTGLGCIGELVEPIDAKELLMKIKLIFNVKTIRHTKLLSHKIKKIALCGGAGAEFASIAASKGADMYITADLKYHDFFSFDNQTVIADIGHFESEQIIKEIFYEQLIDFFPNFATLNANSEKNPVFYI